MPAPAPLATSDLGAAEALVGEVLGSRHQARLGELVDVLAQSALAVWDGPHLAGVVTGTWGAGDDSCELAALAVAKVFRGRGLGGVLLEAAASAALHSGSTRLWLVTTNDNLDALRLYQRHDFRMTELNAGAVDRARHALKPPIPATGAHGIPIHDEIVLVRSLA
jgi:ribosomal protein S18 acetylase RimI-like enzyme